MKKFTRVEVDWADASGYSGWQTDDDEFEITPAHTMGYMVSQDKKKIIIAQSLAEHSKAGLGNVMVIPNDWIVKLKRLK